jgi:YHS domain-containing protein
MAKKKEEEISEKEQEEREKIYTEEGVEEKIASDNMNPEDAGFMEGYDNPRLVQCGGCGKEFDLDSAIERQVEGTTFWFCSEKCAQHFDKRKATV